MRWLALVVIWALCLGAPVAFVSWTPARSSAAPVTVPAAPGIWALQWDSSIALGPDPFAMADEPALRISLDGQRWQQATLAAHQPGLQELPALGLRQQRLMVQALPEPGSGAGALRLRLLRDDEMIAEQVWWLEPGALLSASWELDIPRWERQRGR